MRMSIAQIRERYNQGDSHWEILADLVDEGIEYPDAVWKMTSALRLDADEVAEMEQGYDENC